MMELYLQPAKGLVIKKPDGSKLAAEGEKVPRTSFWLKRLADGDVNEVKPAAKATKKPQVKE
ncbi:DUF2635 domain-containing protein [Aeromonas sp. JL9]|nr:DUF2635 domain-containing protein [Aeromonas sp. JL9]MCQ4108088.1 DUF2635 domain-containing protein [Aeromonas sp. JL9]